MCWHHFRGITVVTTFALILMVAYQHPAAADCGNPPGPRDCVADLDGDGDTDLSDFGILLADWGCTKNCRGDIDGDDDTD